MNLFPVFVALFVSPKEVANGRGFSPITTTKHSVSTIMMTTTRGGDGGGGSDNSDSPGSDKDIPVGIPEFFAQVAAGCTNLDDDFVWEVQIEALGLNMEQTKQTLVTLCSKIQKSLPDMTSQVLECYPPIINEKEGNGKWHKVIIQRSGTFSGAPLKLGNMPVMQPNGKFVQLPPEEHWVLLEEPTGKVVRAKTTAQNPTLYDALASS